MAKYPLYDRELSWLSFNHRVLQECMDPKVPFFEKIKFMAIFSSNLDEFFRVRVASLRNLLNLKSKDTDEINPAKLLKRIHDYVYQQQVQLGDIYKNVILKGLTERNIHLINSDQFNEQQKEFSLTYFKENILPYCQPILLSKNTSAFLQNKQLYLAISLITGKKPDKEKPRRKYALVEIPVDYTGRFVMLSPENNKKFITFIDDIIKSSLYLIFPGYQIENSYSVKLTRDAEMYIDDEFGGNLLDKIKKGINRRKAGVPSRFLYDESMPAAMLKYIREALSLSQKDLVAGGRYHNFSDFFSFPRIGDPKDYDEPLNPLSIKKLELEKELFSLINEQDILLSYPYQKYNSVPSC